MPILIDGNNLLHQLPHSERSRARVRRLVLDACRHQRRRITVVFDGPPPAAAPPREDLGAVTVLYSGSQSADDVIVGRIPAGSRASDWVVVTDDRDLQARARHRGAAIRTLAEWLKTRPPAPRKAGFEHKLSPREVEEWEGYFREEGGE